MENNNDSNVPPVVNSVPQADSIVALKLPSFSKLLSDSFDFYKKNFNLILGIASIPLIFALISFLSEAGIFNVSKNPYLLILTSIFVFMAAIAVLASRVALIDLVTGKSQSFAVAYKNGFNKIIPFIVLSFLSSLIIVGGGFLLIIPAVILMVLSSVSMYVFFVEGNKGLSAIARSWYYVKGYWWQVFGRLILFTLCIFILSLILNLVTGNLGASLALKDSINSGVKNSANNLYSVLELIVSNVIILPVSVIYYFNIYKSLKQIKESSKEVYEEKKLKKQVTIFLVIGIVGFFALFTFIINFLSNLGPVSF